MIFYGKYLLGLFTLLYISAAESYQLKDDTIERLFFNSKFVHRVTVISGNVNTVPSKKGEIDCGNLYEASVVLSLKGDLESVSFQAFSNLKVGKDYLIFFNDYNFDAYLNYVSMGKNDHVAFDACNEKDQIYASEFHGMIYEFDSSLSSINDSEFIKYFHNNVSFPSAVKEYIASTKVKLLNDESKYTSFSLVCWDSLKSYLLKLKD